MPEETITIAEYLLERLLQLGVRHIFGVPGDFNLTFLDYIEASDKLEWVGNCNELNAAYAADGYARIKQVEHARERVGKVDEEQRKKGAEGRVRGGVYGLGVVVTTFGVGELSCTNGIAGAYSEHVPVLHIVGVPSTTAWASHPILHHTLGDGRFDAYQKTFQPITAYQAYLQQPERAADMIDEVLRGTLKKALPGYLTLPTDLVNVKIPSKHLQTPLFPPNVLTTDEKSKTVLEKKTDEEIESWVVNRIVELWEQASSPVILLDACCIRFGVQHLAEDLIEVTGAPWFTAPMGKTALDETHPRFAGVYSGVTSAPSVKKAFESADFVITVGTILSDFNSGSFSWRLPISQTIQLHSDHCRIQYGRYDQVTFYSVLPELVKRLGKKKEAGNLVPLDISGDSKHLQLGTGKEIRQDAFWKRVESFLTDGDIVVGETGTSLFGLLGVKMPNNAIFVGQTLWGSIGWTGGAVLGCLVAAREAAQNISGKHRRVLLFIGDGSFQLTVQEVSTMVRMGLKPIIVVLNNDGYVIERTIHGENAKYNDIQGWDWQALLPLFKPRSYKNYRASTMSELETVFSDPEFAKADQIQLLEVIMDRLDAPFALRTQVGGMDTHG